MLVYTPTHKLPKPAKFLKIVYSKAKVDGKLNLVPFELYADGSLKRCY